MIKKRILIFGADTYLGNAISNHFEQKNVELYCCGSKDSVLNWETGTIIDYHKKDDVKRAIKSFYPDFIINCFENKDFSDKEKIWKDNVNFVEYIIRYSMGTDSHLIQFSTAEVFDGNSGNYSEKDKPYPQNYYGRSKLAAENLITASEIRYTIVRFFKIIGENEYEDELTTFIKENVILGNSIPLNDETQYNPLTLNDLLSLINNLLIFPKNGIYHAGINDFISDYKYALFLSKKYNFDSNFITRLANGSNGKFSLINLKAQTELSLKFSSL